MRKGQLMILKAFAIALVVCGITLTIGQDILTQMGNSYSDNSSYEYNSTLDTQAGLGEISGWFETIGLVIAAAVVLGVVGMFVANR